MTPQRKSAVATLIGLGFAVALAAIVSFYAIFYTSARELNQVSADLYLHPFVVNNAAASLKTTLYQMRSETLSVVLQQTRNEQWRKSSAQIEAYERSAQSNLQVIRRNFLGDMSRVDLLEQEFNAWRGIRTAILADVKTGHFAAANQKVMDEGTPAFNAMLGQVDYILSYSQRKAGQFVADAAHKSSEVIRTGQIMALALFATVLATAVAVIWRVRFLHQELTRQATLDALTGINNRRNFMALVQDEAYRATRYGQPLSLAVVDLDHFKRVNDTFGHHAGDLVLRHFCAVCMADLRQSDAIGRIGGEEFAILMPNTTAADARAVIERIRQTLADSMVLEGGAEIRITGSFGLVTSPGANATPDLDELFKAADLALYAAKAGGRNQVVTADMDAARSAAMAATLA